MDDRFYRGARPGKKDFAALKALGISTIIDLTDNTPGRRGLAEAAGLKYVNIAIPDKSTRRRKLSIRFSKSRQIRRRVRSTYTVPGDVTGPGIRERSIALTRAGILRRRIRKWRITISTPRADTESRRISSWTMPRNLRL